MTLLDRPQSLPEDPVECRVSEMDTVRGMAAQIVGGPHGERPFALSDEEWESLCSCARGASNERAAIARVIEQACRQRDASRAISRSIPVGAPVGLADGKSPSLDESHGSPSLGASAGLAPTSVPPIPVGFGVPAVEDAVPAYSETDPSYNAYVPTLVPSFVHDPPESSTRPASRIRASGIRLRRRTRTRFSLSAVDDRNREKWLSIASWVRNIGAIILLFVAWQLWGTAITQHHSQTELKQQFQAKVAHVITKPGPTFRLIPATTKIGDPPQGTVMAQIQIPKIAVSQYVVSGIDEDDLAKGPGHYLGTAMPGQAGNVAIAGHRTTHGAPFNRLGELAIGDPIYLTTLGGQRLTYIVSATPVAVSPTDVTVLNNFGDNRLTLTTCNPEFSARQRLIIVAAYLPPGASHPPPIAKGSSTPYNLGPAATNGWDTSLIPLVLLVGGLLVALGLLNRRLSRTYGREGRWLILGPVWIALLLALFQTLTNFLPASV